MSKPRDVHLWEWRRGEWPEGRGLPSRKAELGQVSGWWWCRGKASHVGMWREGCPVMAAVPADSSGWLGGVLLQSPIKHPLPPGLAEFWWTRPWVAFLPMRAQENLGHVQHGSFESAGDSSAAQRRRKLAQGHTAGHLWGWGWNTSHWLPIPEYLSMFPFKFQH